MLSQAEADSLIAMEKKVDKGITEIRFPIPGDTVTIPLTSFDGRERFLLDIQRGRRVASNWGLQLRYRGTEILVRVDIGGASHPNPPNAPSRNLSPYEGKRIPTPHLQRYVEGYGDTWAVPLPGQFTNPRDDALTLEQFLKYCCVADYPPLQERF